MFRCCHLVEQTALSLVKMMEAVSVTVVIGPSPARDNRRMVPRCRLSVQCCH